jgi:hypothetical protein
MAGISFGTFTLAPVCYLEEVVQVVSSPTELLNKFVDHDEQSAKSVLDYTLVATVHNYGSEARRGRPFKQSR